MRRTSVFLLACALLVLASGCVVSKNPITGKSRAYGYTWSQERAIGTDADASVLAQYGMYEDPELSAYIDSLGQALLEVSHLRRPGAAEEYQETPFTFRVLDSPVVNAFALPGGFVYVTRGLLAHLENEAQLAVVLGHEIGHVAGRHASKRAASQAFGQALLIGGAIGGQVFLGDEAAESILQLGGTAAQLLFLSYGRDDERESDDLGVEYASLLGYDASQGAAFFTSLKRLGEQSGQSLPGFLSTHPDPGEREREIRRMAAEADPLTPGSRVERDGFLAHLGGIVAGDNPRQGYTENNVFYHPDLAFQFPVPTGFTVVNQASRVVLVEANQQAVVYFGIETDAASARDAAAAMTQEEGLTVVQSGLGSAYGLPAQYVVADVQNQDGSIVRLRAHYVDYGERVYSFLGMTAQSAYSTWEPSFVQSMQGFAPLRDPAVLGIQPSRLTVGRTGSASSFQALVPTSLPRGFSAEGLAILNQVELTDQLAAGSRYKMVR